MTVFSCQPPEFQKSREIISATQTAEKAKLTAEAAQVVVTLSPDVPPDETLASEPTATSKPSEEAEKTEDLSSTSTPVPTFTPIPTAIPTAQSVPVLNTDWVRCDGEIVHIEERNFYVNKLATCHISLAKGEFIVGTVDRFQENVEKSPEGTPCTAYLIKGPIETNVTMWYGGGDFYSATSTYTDAFLDERLQEKVDELKAHETCPIRAAGEFDIRVISDSSN